MDHIAECSYTAGTAQAISIPSGSPVTDIRLGYAYKLYVTVNGVQHIIRYLRGTAS